MCTQFQANGGSCIVENSTFGLNRKIKYIPEASRKSGLHIVAGAGRYNTIHVFVYEISLQLSL